VEPTAVSPADPAVPAGDATVNRRFAQTAGQDPTVDLRKEPHNLLCAGGGLSTMRRRIVPGLSADPGGPPRGPDRWANRFAPPPMRAEISGPWRLGMIEVHHELMLEESADPRWEARCKQDAQKQVTGR
jgi:hypothetical protein